MLLQNDDETIWRAVAVRFAREGNGEMERMVELRSSINDFLAVQRDVKDRLT